MACLCILMAHLVCLTFSIWAPGLSLFLLNVYFPFQPPWILFANAAVRRHTSSFYAIPHKHIYSHTSLHFHKQFVHLTLNLTMSFNIEAFVSFVSRFGWIQTWWAAVEGLTTLQEFFWADPKWNFRHYISVLTFYINMFFHVILVLSKNSMLFQMWVSMLFLCYTLFTLSYH